MNRRRQRIGFHTPNLATVGGSDVTIARLLGGLPPDEWDVVLLVHGGYPLEAVFGAEELARLTVIELDEAPRLESAAEAESGPARRSPKELIRSLWRRMPASWRDAVGYRRLIAERAEQLRAARLDVLYVTDPFVHEMVHAARAIGCPVAVRFNGWFADGDRVARRRDRTAYDAADACVAVSRFIAEGWAEHLGDGSKFQVIYNGAPQPEPVDRAALRAELGLRPEDLVIGMTGRMIQIKGAPTLLEAAATFLPALPAAALVFCGDGDALPAMRARAKELGLAERIRFLGWRPDAPRITAAYDLAVVPSQWPDPMPNTVLEAMAWGIPVVASSIGGIPEVVGDEVGRTVPPGDVAALAEAVGAIAGDPARRPALGAAARRLVDEQFSLEAMRVRHRELLGRLLDGPR